MRRVASGVGVALLLLVVLVHFRYQSLADWLHPGRAEYAGRALFYVLRGMEGAAAFAALLVLAPPSRVLSLACIVGLLAELSTALCRLSWPLTEPVPAGAGAGGLCDAATRAPITAALAGFIFGALLFLNNKKGPGHG